MPAEAANLFQVLQAAVPAIEGDETRSKAACFSGMKHGTQMVILGQTINGFVVEAIVTWDGVCAIAPQQRDQIDPRDNAMMFAGPVAVDEFNLPSIGFVERRVINNQQTIVERDMLLGFLPKRCGVRVEAVKQACEWSSWAAHQGSVGFDTSSFSA